MTKKDICPRAKLSEDDNWHGSPQTDERLEAAVGQLLDAEADCEDEDPYRTGSRSSRDGCSTPGYRRKQEIEALLERMVSADKAFLEYPN